MRQRGYDALYRLLSATGRETAGAGTKPWKDKYRPENNGASRGYTQYYEYDKLGNIQELQHVASGGNFTRTFNYVSGKNKLEEIEIGANTYSFTHDVNGNIIQEDTNRHFAYDYADRLKAFYIQTSTEEPSTYTQYFYDAGGNRVKKISRVQGGGSTKTTVYIDGIFEHTIANASEAIPDLEIGPWIIGYGSGEQNTLHIMDGSSRVATRRIGDSMDDTTPAIKYNLEDHLGSSNLLLSTDGTLVSKEEYYPFGETSFGSYGKKRYRFCGKEKDEESGLYYFGARYYNAWTCRFTSTDPLALKHPFYSPYLYAGNKPINLIDVDGLEPGGPKDGKPPANSPQMHKVKKDETLGSIAKRYGTTADALRKANNLDPAQDKQLQIGTQLKVPSGSGSSSSPQNLMLANKANPASSDPSVLGANYKPTNTSSEPFSSSTKSDAQILEDVIGTDLGISKLSQLGEVITSPFKPALEAIENSKGNSTNDMWEGTGSGGVGGSAKIGWQKHSVSAEARILGTTEDNISFHMSFNYFNTENLKMSKIEFPKTSWTDFKPSAEVNAFVFISEKRMGDTGGKVASKTTSYVEGSLAIPTPFVPLKGEINSDGTTKIGVMLKGNPNVKAGMVTKNSIYFTSKPISIGGNQ